MKAKYKNYTKSVARTLSGYTEQEIAIINQKIKDTTKDDKGRLGYGNRIPATWEEYVKSNPNADIKKCALAFAQVSEGNEFASDFRDACDQILGKTASGKPTAENVKATDF